MLRLAVLITLVVRATTLTEDESRAFASDDECTAVAGEQCGLSALQKRALIDEAQPEPETPEPADPEPEPPADESPSDSNKSPFKLKWDASNEHPFLKKIRLRLTHTMHTFFKATETIENRTLRKADLVGCVGGLVEIVGQMEGTVALYAPKLLNAVNQIADSNWTSATEMMGTVDALKRNVRPLLSQFLKNTGELIGEPHKFDDMRDANPYIQDQLIEHLSELLTEYIIKDGNTTVDTPNPKACVENIMAVLHSAIKFQEMRSNAHADCSMPGSEADCTSDAIEVLTAYAKSAKSVAATAFDCGGYRDTCSQEISKAHVSFLVALGNVIVSEENCNLDNGSKHNRSKQAFFEDWCATEVLDDVDDFKHLAEDLRGVTAVCQIKKAEADELHAAIDMLDEKLLQQVPTKTSDKPPSKDFLHKVWDTIQRLR